MAITLTAGTSVESTGSVTSTTVTLPSGLSAGDATIIVVSLNASSGVITTPAGWTNILASTNTANGSTSCAVAIFYRAWQSGDTNPAITTSNGRVAATPIRVQGADAGTLVDVAATVTQAASGATTLVAPTITPTTGHLVCVFAGRRAQNGVYLTPFSNLSAGMTLVAEANGKATTQTNAGHCFAYEAVTPNSATGTRQVDPAGATTGAMGISFSLNESSASTIAVSATGIASAQGVGAPVILGTSAITTAFSDFDDGTEDGWTAVTAGGGTTAITTAAAHDGAYGASANVPSLTGEQAGFNRTVPPSRSVTIRGWWKVTTEGSVSNANVPFARVTSGGQRLADVYRQNLQANANVWMRVVQEIGGNNYYYIPTGYTLPLDTWVYISFTWGLDGIPHLFIDGVEYLNESDAPADFYAGPTIDTVWLGSSENGGQGAWAIDTVDVIATPTVGGDSVRVEPILTGEAFGSPTATVLAGPVIPDGIATGEALGTPAVSTTLTASPAGIADGGGFGSPTITRTLTVSPSGVATGQALGAPAVSGLLITSPSGVATGQAFGTPTVTKTLTASPAGIASGQAMGSPSATAVLTASPSGIASGQALGTPIAATTLTASPSGIATEQTFGNPTVGGNFTASPAGIASAQAFGTPSVATTQFVSATGIASEQAMGTPSLAMPVTASPVGIPTAEAFGTARAAASQQSNPDGITSAEAFGEPALAATLAVTPPGIPGAAAFGSPTATVQDLNKTLNPAGIPSAGAFGTPNVIGNRTVGPQGIASLESFGTPRQSNVLVAIVEDIPSIGNVFGAPSVTTRLTAGPIGIATAQAVGLPTLIKVVLQVGPVGIVSLESFGAPRATGGSAATPYEMAGAMLARRYSGRLGGPENTAIKPTRWEGTLG